MKELNDEIEKMRKEQHEILQFLSDDLSRDGRIRVEERQNSFREGFQYGAIWMKKSSKAHSTLDMVHKIIDDHGCSSPKDCGLHFLKEKLAAV